MMNNGGTQTDKPYSPEEGGATAFNPAQILDRFLPEIDSLEAQFIHSRLDDEEAVGYIWTIGAALRLRSRETLLLTGLALSASIGGGGLARAEGGYVAAGSASPQLIPDSPSKVRRGLGKLGNIFRRDRSDAVPQEVI